MMGIEPTASGLYDPRRNPSDNQASYPPDPTTLSQRLKKQNFLPLGGLLKIRSNYN